MFYSVGLVLEVLEASGGSSSYSYTTRSFAAGSVRGLASLLLFHIGPCGLSRRLQGSLGFLGLPFWHRDPKYRRTRARDIFGVYGDPAADNLLPLARRLC
ncbi:hypothetical protein AAF712_009446 [Marasmius tenuissimus]|uniref:Uncharacterized protein n=1 Tax=Marasmius tenuissimus TaxID=585030 RepID=A0ABR2ZSD3_9AGAR